MPAPPSRRHPSTLDDEALLAEVDLRRHRASGPGGQRRNKVETAVQLIHRPTGLMVEASERRSLEVNRKVGLGRLRLALALGHREPVTPEGFQPSALWEQRTGGARLSVSAQHPDVAALLAEALDVLAAMNDDVAAASALLGVGSSRLVRVLRLEPAALSSLNARRREAGRRPYL